jgi:hypothetical protein
MPLRVEPPRVRSGHERLRQQALNFGLGSGVK